MLCLVVVKGVAWFHPLSHVNINTTVVFLPKASQAKEILNECKSQLLAQWINNCSVLYKELNQITIVGPFLHLFFFFKLTPSLVEMIQPSHHLLMGHFDQ